MRLTTILLAALLAAPRVHAQAAPTLHPGDRFFGAWGGASFYAPGGSQLGSTTDRDLFLAGVRAEWVLETPGPFAVAATMDAIPLAIVTRNPYYTNRVVGYAMSMRGPVALLEVRGRGPVYGVGASPLGLELFAPRMGAVRPYFAAAAGILCFTRNTPEPETRRLNGTFEMGGGLRITPAGREGRYAWTLGWKFHHLSNAYTAPYNPGLDGNVVYLGVMRRR